MPPSLFLRNVILSIHRALPLNRHFCSAAVAHDVSSEYIDQTPLPQDKSISSFIVINLVYVAMSGGVDSSMAAALLQRQGLLELRI